MARNESPIGQRPSRNFAGRTIGAAAKTARGAANVIDKYAESGAKRMAKAAESIAIPVSDNLFPNLTPEEHRVALIESCINTDEIFTEHLTDPSDKASRDFRDYMFYQQFYFLVAAQMTQPDPSGSMLPGIIGGLSMVAGAALVNESFRKNLTEHMQDSLLKYVEPFKESAPKLWQQLSAHVESHPGCVSPESVALKLLRYQRQAADMIAGGEDDIKHVNELLTKKTAELKAAADSMNLNWSEIVSIRNKLAKDMDQAQEDRINRLGVDWQTKGVIELDSLEPGLAQKSQGGNSCRNWRDTEFYEAPIDVESAARKLLVYQMNLQEAVEDLHEKGEGDAINPKYAHLAGKTEAEYFAESVEEVAKLKKFCDTMKIDWGEVTKRYDEMNRSHYDSIKKPLSFLEQYVDEPNRQKLLPNGSPNPNFGKPNQKYFEDVKAAMVKLKEQERTGRAMDIQRPPKCNAGGVLTDYVEAVEEMDKHNKRMYYELPVDAASAGRCLKKYQQEAYMRIRHDASAVHKDGQIDSATAYSLANELCKAVRVASDVMGFHWGDTIKEYRKDVYKTVLKDHSKVAIWKEMVDGDIITHIPKSTTTYKTDSSGRAVKEVRPLSRKEQLEAWDGTVYNADGSKAKDDVLMHVRNPYTEDEASKALYGLFIKDFKMQLDIERIKENHTELDKDGNETMEPKYEREIKKIEDARAELTTKRNDLLEAFKSDKFDASLIQRVEQRALNWFQEAKRQMAHGVAPEAKPAAEQEVKLDESLAPREPEDDGDELIGLPDKNQPEF